MYINSYLETTNIYFSLSNLIILIPAATKILLMFNKMNIHLVHFWKNIRNLNTHNPWTISTPGWNYFGDYKEGILINIQNNY